MQPSDVTRLWTTIVGTPDPQPDSNFFDEGGDSLALLELTETIEASIGAQLDLDRFLDDPTLETLVRLSDQGGTQT